MKSQVMYVWASSENWQIKQQVMLPQQKIQSISIGQDHIIIRTQNRILGLGNNSKGQLGVQTYEQKVNELVQLRSKFTTNKIKQIACGWNHTLVLDQFGSVFSAGEGKNGALGYGRGADSHQFKIISNLKNIKYISAGRDHSLALSSIKVYGWGNSMEGQLGIPKQKICYEPEQLYVYASFLCYAGSKYSIFITEKGIYVTGQNDAGQLGLGNKTRIKMPRKLNGILQEIKQISGSTNYIFYQTMQSQYYLCGTGCLGQYLYPTKIKQLRHCEKVIVGQDFGVVKSQNSILTWNAPKDNFPIQNPQLTIFPVQNIVVGPKIIVCQISSNVQKRNRNERVAASQRNEYMVRSSIQWSNFQTNNQICYAQSIPNSMDIETNMLRSNERKSRKQSQAIQGQKLNAYSQYQEYDRSKYDSKFDQNDMGIWKSHNKKNYIELSKSNNTYRNKTYGRQEITSPHFRDQASVSDQLKGDENYVQNDDGISQLNQQMQIQNSGQITQQGNSKINRSKQKQNISNLTNKNGQSISDKQLFNLSVSQRQVQSKNRNIPNNNNKLQENNIEKQLKQQIQNLEKQNRRKQQCIQKMRRQLLDLMQIVQSDACLKNVLSRKGKEHLLHKKSQSLQFQKPDIFTTNTQLLRNLLGRTIDSLAYSQ